MPGRIFQWLDRNIFELGREMRLSYLPPLMVYMAYGVSSLTAIVGTFFIKEYLGLSAAFLAALGFWAGIPWVLKMPLGHLVDLFWRWKYILVFLGAGLITLSLLIMTGLIGHTDFMRQYASVEAWFVASALLAPVGYVIQDVVADAMTVEAVPHVDEQGNAFSADEVRLMHTTMQTLGRVAIVGGGVLVSVVNIVVFRDSASMTEAVKVGNYVFIYELALLIPVISVLGVILAIFLRARKASHLRKEGFDKLEVKKLLEVQTEPTQVNWWILGGSLVFVVFTLSMGLLDIPFNQEIVFIGSMSIVVFLIYKLTRVLDDDSKKILVGTAIIIFVFRALPGPGAGSSWWMMDVLGFDQQFFSVLQLIGASLTLAGMFIFRRFMAERSMAYIIGFLTVAGFVLSLPIVGMYYGLHVWTAALTGGVVDAHFIALVDTALESPLGQIAMIPMLAWIANSAPASLKATFFAVMASFANLSLSLSQLSTKYLNQIYTVTREVKEHATQAIKIPADYSELGILLITVTVIALVLPFLAIWIVRISPLKALGDR